MADSVQARQQRSRLIREMAQDLNKTTNSVASSTGSKHGTVSTDSTQSDFNPQKDEAIMSTQQMHADYSQKLPQLRDTAKKYGRWAPRPQQEFVINTSAIGRAFPDFSQGGSSDDDISIEVGRGNKKQRPNSNSYTEYSGDANSPVVTINNKHQLLHTPNAQQVKASNPYLQEALRNYSRQNNSNSFNIEHKENIPPADKLGKDSLYTSHASRANNGERRTLAELHARVADETEGSFIGEERPATITFQSKSTRFSNVQTRNPQPTANSSKKHQSSDHLNDSIRKSSGTPSKSRSQVKITATPTANSNTPNPTQQSFLIPTIPDSSEQGTVTIHEGIPVFSRDGRVQGRYASGRSQRKGSHGPVDGIEVPDDEENIYLMVDILKERVAQLELGVAEYQSLVRDLESENLQLKIEKKTWMSHKCSDSAFGDSGSDGGSRRYKKLEHEKTRLQEENMALKTRFESLEKRMSRTELLIKTNSAERDQAIKQLAQAQSTKEQLEQKNEVLKDQFTESANITRRTKAVETLEDLTQGIREKTQEVDASRDYSLNESDFMDVFPAGTIPKLRQRLREVQQVVQPKSDNWTARLERIQGLEQEIREERAEFEKDKAEHQNTIKSSRAESVKSNQTTRSKASHRRVHSETSIHTTRRARTDDLTSAFIIPDILSKENEAHTERPASVTERTEKPIPILKHVEKPIPVSQRMPDSPEYDEEPTLRPSVAPEIALAIVIRDTRTEIEKLKAKLEEVQEAYRLHDGSLSKRLRLRLEGAIKRLVDEISVKSDSLYLLYDIVEGNKQEGDEANGTQMSMPWEGIASSVY